MGSVAPGKEKAENVEQRARKGEKQEIVKNFVRKRRAVLKKERRDIDMGKLLWEDRPDTAPEREYTNPVCCLFYSSQRERNSLLC